MDLINPASLAIVLIFATGGAAVWVAMYRDVFFPQVETGRRRPRVRRLRPTVRTETKPKRAEVVSINVSGTATPKSDPEMIAFRAIAKLVKAGHITQTDALCSAFDVKAGSSKAYTAVLEKYKSAAAELDKMEAIADEAAATKS